MSRPLQGTEDHFDDNLVPLGLGHLERGQQTPRSGLWPVGAANWRGTATLQLRIRLRVLQQPLHDLGVSKEARHVQRSVARDIHGVDLEFRPPQQNIDYDRMVLLHRHHERRVAIHAQVDIDGWVLQEEAYKERAALMHCHVKGRATAPTPDVWVNARVFEQKLHGLELAVAYCNVQSCLLACMGCPIDIDTAVEHLSNVFKLTMLC